MSESEERQPQPNQETSAAGSAPQPEAPPPPETPAPQTPRTEPMGTASLICGIASFIFGICCGVVGMGLAIVAIVLGLVSLSKIKREPELWEGKGLAIAGIVLGGVAILISIVTILLYGLTWFAQVGHRMRHSY